jgi:hypothetical protein
MTQSQQCSVPLNISFRRSLRGDTSQSWYELVAKVADVRLNNREDKFHWGHTKNEIFTVRSMYNAIIVQNIWENRLLWKLKLQLKIKIFMVFKQRGDPYKGQPSLPKLDRQHEMCFL